MSAIPASAAVEALSINPVASPDALAYALAGWPVFPVHSLDGDGRCTCGKDCGRDVAKHPRTTNGLHAATTDPRRIQAWWNRWPDANIGMATGRPAGVFVLDVDADKGGWESAEALEDAHGPFPATRGVQTGGGGLHLYFRWPDQGGIKNSAGGLAPGLDVRARGGYVLMPPSLHRSGRRYSWAALDSRDGEPGNKIATAPAWLLALLIERPVAASAFRSSQPRIEGSIPEGQRNSTLTSLAGSMRQAGFTEAEILAALERVNADRCQPALEARELEKIAKSIGRYPPAANKGRSTRLELVGGKLVAS